MAIRKVWIVQGFTGEYADRTEWMVKGFFDVNKAEQLVKDLDYTYQQYPNVDKRGWPQTDKEFEAAMKKLDPNFMEDYTGTTYGISYVEVEDA